MSHCRFLLVPADGPARVIDGHPHPSTVSDALGGAIPVPVHFGHGAVAAWVRETAATEGLDPNPAASCLARLMGGGVTPLVGPVAFTSIVWERAGDSPYLAGKAEGFPKMVVDSMAVIVGDLWRAIHGHDSGFSSDRLDHEWANRVRDAAEDARRAPLPEGWPYATEATPRDDVAVLMRRLGLGQAFAPVPVRV